MLRLKLLYGIGLISVILFSNGGMAMETGFESKIMDQELQNLYWERIQLSVTSIEDSSSKICSFDVSENGQIALGLCNNTISIYDSDSTFQRSYQFNTYGSYFVEWDNNNLNIFLVRSSLIVQVDNDGNLTEIREVINSSQYIDRLRKTRKIVVNDSQYIIKNEHGVLNIFAGYTYSKMVKIYSDGTETIIYDVSSSHMRSILLGVIISSIFIAIVIGGLIKYISSLPPGKRLFS